MIDNEPHINGFDRSQHHEPVTISIIVKDEESRYKRDFLVYEDVVLNTDDDIILQCKAITLKEWGREPDSIKIKITLDVL